MELVYIAATPSSSDMRTASNSLLYTPVGQYSTRARSHARFEVSHVLLLAGPVLAGWFKRKDGEGEPVRDTFNRGSPLVPGLSYAAGVPV